MYIAVGVYPDLRDDARLPYETLDEALQKLRDWVEADELDEEPMFCRYGLELDPPLPPYRYDDDDEASEEDDSDDEPIVVDLPKPSPVAPDEPDDNIIGPFRMPTK